MGSFDRQNSDGLTWADQWDYKNEDPRSAADVQGGHKDGGKLATYNKKVKAAASVGLDKAKDVATAGAHKVKSGTSSGIRWIKDQYQKRTSK